MKEKLDLILETLNGLKHEVSKLTTRVVSISEGQEEMFTVQDQLASNQELLAVNQSHFTDRMDRLEGNQRSFSVNLIRMEEKLDNFT